MAGQVFTTETGAVRGLAALAWAHPAEFSAALRVAGVPLTGDILPGSVSLERARTDLYLESAHEVVVVEAKVDDFSSSEQIDKYREFVPDATFVLLVPDARAPDVLATKADQTGLHVVEWDQLLGALHSVNSVTALLASDVQAVRAQPSAKGTLRKLMHAARADIQPPQGVTAELTHSAGRRPCLDVRAEREWILGQVEGPRDANAPPGFKATVGVLLEAEDETDLTRRENVRRVLETAWTELEEAETAGEIELSRDSKGSKLADIFGIERPYRARGYRGSHVGIITVSTPDAGTALRWAVRAAEAYRRAMRAHWPSLQPGAATALPES